MDELQISDVIDQPEIPSLETNVADILKGDDANKIIEALKSGRVKPLPSVSTYRKEYEPEEHKIFSPAYLPDRKVKYDTGLLDENGLPKYGERLEKVNRLAFPFQKRIVSSAVSFAFGNPVNLNCEPKDSAEEKVLQAVKRFAHDCKLKSFNRQQMRDLCRVTEVAELWYVKPYSSDNVRHGSYGFPTSLKISVASFSPWEGDKLYPYFDGTGDLIAFSRQFSRLDAEENEINFFETYTADEYVLWKEEKSGAGWVEVKAKRNKNLLGKIPVVYVRQEQTEWMDVQWSIERLEFLLSKFAETNDYHAAPKIFVEGRLTGFAQKGESGAILQGDKDAKAYYLSWDHAPESVKLEIETLLRFIYGFTQTPDISFDSVKGLHQISGESLKMLFMDAHLKVEEKREYLDMFLQRRINIQKAFVAKLAPALKSAAENVEIEPEIIPYIINDDTTKIANLVTANGGKPIMSQKTSVAQLGWVDDVEEEFNQIQEEERQSNVVSVFPTGE